jgi:ADP-ribose pyrophosphatase YjhB (NUDIX family)
MPHIHEKIDFTSEVFIVYQNKVLLRKHDKYDIWLSVGGHIELDEDPNEAAVREVKEEVGLDIQLYRQSYVPSFSEKNYRELIPPMFRNRHRINSTHEHITEVYFARALTDNLILSEKEKSNECRWFTLQDLNNEIFGINDMVKFYAKTALKILT